MLAPIRMLKRVRWCPRHRRSRCVPQGPVTTTTICACMHMDGVVLMSRPRADATRPLLRLERGEGGRAQAVHGHAARAVAHGALVPFAAAAAHQTKERIGDEGAPTRSGDVLRSTAVTSSDSEPPCEGARPRGGASGCAALLDGCNGSCRAAGGRGSPGGPTPAPSSCHASAACRGREWTSPRKRGRLGSGKVGLLEDLFLDQMLPSPSESESASPRKRKRRIGDGGAPREAPQYRGFRPQRKMDGEG